MSKHIVICGYCRSGGTLFYNMLRTSVINYHFLDQEHPAEQIIGNDADSWITKRPLDVFRIKSILEANHHNKEIVVLVMLRDIRSILTSRHSEVPGEYFIGFDHQYFIDSKKGDIGYTNPGIVAIHEAIMGLSEIKNITVQYLHYEEMVMNTQEVQDRFQNELFFQYKAGFSDAYQPEQSNHLLAPRNSNPAMETSRIIAWKNGEHYERILAQFKSCPRLLEILRVYGYEENDEWFGTFLKGNL
jgi:hypothetical protein